MQQHHVRDVLFCHLLWPLLLYHLFSLVLASVLRLFTSKYLCLLRTFALKKNKDCHRPTVIQHSFYSVGIWLFFYLYLLRVALSGLFQEPLASYSHMYTIQQGAAQCTHSLILPTTAHYYKCHA